MEFQQISMGILNSSLSIQSRFKTLPFDKSWSFEGLTQKDTNYITHGYHRYPAKFIPQLVARLITELSQPGDLVVDPFMGSGTALVEAKVLGRPSVGVDINPVAHLIAKAKVTPIEPRRLERVFTEISLNFPQRPKEMSIFSEVNFIREQAAHYNHKRIDYWFTPKTKEILISIYERIRRIKDRDIRDFFLCGFSHILKNCSIWLMKSNKPTRDFKKVISDPYFTFNRHLKKMIKKNKEFWDLLIKKCHLEIKANPICGDARNVPISDKSAALVVTSPPYVTSYEYADLHQLTALWFQYANDLKEFRRKFIGSAYVSKREINIGSALGEEIVQKLKENGTGKSIEVAIYFTEMRESFIEMKRYLKKGGKACIVIGDTSFKDVPVLNAEVFVEQMQNIGFKIYRIIKRRIPFKILPQMRDPLTGRFTSSNNITKTLAYPYEYIIIMQKK